jgi:hypothetical protein
MVAADILEWAEVHAERFAHEQDSTTTVVG